MDKRNYAMKERVMSKGGVKKEVQEDRETLEKKGWRNWNREMRMKVREGSEGITERKRMKGVQEQKGRGQRIKKVDVGELVTEDNQLKVRYPYQV